ncbi:MAG: hypothetical protein ACRDV9_02965 [Acidimicrobiia bacterium]
MGRTTAASSVLAVVLAVAGVGCGGGGPAFEQDEADSVLSYILVDYSIGGDTRAKGPELFFKAANVGSQEHQLEVLDDQGEPVGVIEAFAPGALADPLAVALEAGTYTLQCTLETKDGKAHRDLGMEAKLVVE